MRMTETEMMPYDDHVVGFSGERVGTKGYIELYTTFSEGKNTKTIKIRYLVINANTSYNILLGQQADGHSIDPSPGNEVPFQDGGHSYDPCGPEGGTRVLCRKPPGGTLKVDTSPKRKSS